MKNPVVTISCSIGGEKIGAMKLELFPEIAPNTAQNFVSLAKSGFYNGLIFHRIIENFMIQGGDPSGVGMGGPDYSIRGEFNKNGIKNDLKHERGVISMARSNNMDSAGSQFFICHKAAPHLDGAYAAFGRLLEGEDVLDKLATTETGMQDRPVTDCTMDTVEVDLGEYVEIELEKLPRI